ncbi:23S rRNA (guanosine(2251)-2'-O)-methyltransferase RlmB [Halothiobacillus neapolitanus]|jgi:23S rRNA (guanosine2251-2'-O)-methyltransferase|uniref:23S rRNA (guanosine-2'-O-)-methyltransferase RlmB n=1 Tax=Halothiobacillus neapolitanus (strain ATCC 23641 / DSM 15147 / CIP 104769 / NCIMB 8539 / c2) TaxID=555778 RepID=D0KXP2_HALNC|nr:23S rRNA (guanosine(2251)-2'-O)-methyltransferase RlmB [Halothiobacillus neapolitanus]ACX95215.1 RNA methyltransferase, TrmH family, group 3 [Halothiobacillus neapolitanus c2]TDN57684.1 23S rRNA Gm-2251 2'-O-methyltransferase [Halothiobacillus neapolitanus]
MAERKSASSTQWLSGFHAVEAALQHDPERVLSVIFEQGRQDKRVQQLRVLAESRGVSIEEAPEKVFADRVRADRELARHQGVLARYQPKPAGNEHDLFALLDNLDEPAFLLILDGVTDPHNLGACLRSAEAAGVHAVISPKDRAVGLTPTARKAASGAAERLPFIQVTNLARTLADLKSRQIWIVGAAGGGMVSLYESDFAAESVALVMGSEGEGLRRLTQEGCDQLIFIPMRPPVESLNVSVAAAVCLFEFRRVRDQVINQARALSQ